MAFSTDVLAIDAPDVAAEIENALKTQIFRTMRRRGAVVGVSGGIDSAVVATLAARALGPGKVLALLMPERDSSGDALRLGRALCDHLGVPYVVEDIAPALQVLGCYERQRDAIRQIFPDYAEGWRCKVTLPSILDSDRLNVSMLTIESPTGELQSSRMTSAAYLALIAATNFKQRVRKTMEYHHADRLGYAVAGTPNRLEYDQGFFVKQGDGASDFKPIAHLYKTQVYALAAHLGVPAEIRGRLPTTDTFSMPQSQEEFYFSLPYDRMDLCLWAKNHGITAEEAGSAVGLTPAQVERVYKDIEAKRRATRYLHQKPLLVQEVAEV